MGEQVDNYMEREKAYLNPELSLAELAEETAYSVHILSRTINSHFNKNFFDYISHYRVEYVKTLFREREDIRILEAAFEAGFNSKSVFNLVFKKQTGMTPSEYRKTTPGSP